MAAELFCKQGFVVFSKKIFQFRHVSLHYYGVAFSFMKKSSISKVFRTKF